MAGPKTVLVVEDNEITREGLAAVLRRAGYAVTLAGEGREALALLRVGPPPDLILTDMLMPVLDGWGLLEALRRDPQLAAVPVVILSSLSVGGRDWSASLGASGFLRAPVEREALLAEVRRCLG